MENAPKQLGAVVVVYYPEVGCFLELLEKIVQKADMVLLVDNTDSKDAVALYENEIGKIENVKHIVLGDNCGISKAQNIGLQRIFASGYEYALLLDQDSVVPDDLIDNLIKSVKRLKKRSKVACIGPVIMNKDTKRLYLPKFAKSKGSRYIDTHGIISSGSLILKDAFEEVGGMDESLFIDYVDQEWCLRAGRKGYHSFIDTKIRMGHRIGVGDISILGKGLTFHIPQPVRHYYQFRNFLLLLPRRYIPISWKFKESIKKVMEIFIYTCCVKPRKARSKMILLGIKHGLRNKGGKIDECCKA